MTDEQASATLPGDEADPAGDSTPPANTDEGEGTPPAPKTEVADGDSNPDAEDGADESADADKDPTKRLQRKIERLVAKNGERKAEIERMREELDALKGEREKRELEGLQNLPVLPEALTKEERATVKDARPKLEQAREDARFFWEASENDGYETRDGKRYTAEQCREFARMKERDAAKLEARLDAIMDSGRGRLAKLMKKYGGEILGETAPTTGGQTPEPPRRPAPPKAPTPKQAPERAPGGGAAPSAKDGAGKAPPAAGTQEQLEAAFAFL